MHQKINCCVSVLWFEEVREHCTRQYLCISASAPKGSRINVAMALVLAKIDVVSAIQQECTLLDFYQRKGHQPWLLFFRLEQRSAVSVYLVGDVMSVWSAEGVKSAWYDRQHSKMCHFITVTEISNSKILCFHKTLATRLWTFLSAPCSALTSQLSFGITQTPQLRDTGDFPSGTRLMLMSASGRGSRFSDIV